MKYDKYNLEEVIKICVNWAEVCREFGVSPKGASNSYIKKKAIEFNIDFSHFTNKPRKINNCKKKKNSIEYINSNSKINSSILRKKLIEDGIKENKCETCKNNEWNNKPIPLDLHHIDGNHYNNNLNNLQILCKNCHAQTDNWGSKNIKINKKEKYIPCSSCDNLMYFSSKNCSNCKKHFPYINERIKKEYFCLCGNKINKKSKRCIDCFYFEYKKIIPEKDVLQKEVWETPFVKLADKYNVSDKTIKNWCIKLEINLPPIGYWSLNNLDKGRKSVSKRKIKNEEDAWCSTCQNFLNKNLFSRNKSRWNNVNSLCKKCNAYRMREKRNNKCRQGK